MAKANKLASGSWNVMVFSHYEYANGKKKRIYRSFTAPTRHEAELMASQYANDKKRYQRAEYTLYEAIERYIQIKEHVLSPSTIRTYIQIKDKHLDKIGHIYIDAVTNADLQAWINELSTKVSAKTVKNIYGLVISAISLYSDKPYKVTLPSRQPLHYATPTDAEVAMLIHSARPDLKIAIVLASIGTMRRGEICGLKYKDILRDFSAIYVHSDMVLDKDNRWIHKAMPKTSHSVRTVPLPPEVMAMLPDGDPDAYIVGSTPAAISDAFCRLRKRLGLECRFHDLRHYSASILHAIGMPDQYIMERCGWATDGTLKAVYRNTLADKSKHFSDMANDYFGQLLMQDEMQDGKRKTQ